MLISVVKTLCEMYVLISLEVEYVENVDPRQSGAEISHWICCYSALLKGHAVL